jgi:uncharacterized protein YbjT (DUF2867 family)
MPSHTVVIAGASGLVGGHLLRILLADGETTRVVALVRRPLGVTNAKLEEIVADFGALDALMDRLAADVAFCCLGTTIKVAGSEEAFRKVDHDYPLAFARATLAAGVKRFVIVTAVGAYSKSSVFYNRVKGELEDALRSLAFPNGIVIAHPSMLLGDRTESRGGESIAKAVMRGTGFLMAGPLRKYKAIDAVDVARAMATAARGDGAGVSVLEGDALFLARDAALR